MLSLHRALDRRALQVVNLACKSWVESTCLAPQLAIGNARSSHWGVLTEAVGNIENRITGVIVCGASIFCWNTLLSRVVDARVRSNAQNRHVGQD